MRTKKVEKIIPTQKYQNWSSFKKAPHKNLDMSQQHFSLPNRLAHKAAYIMSHIKKEKCKINSQLQELWKSAQHTQAMRRLSKVFLLLCCFEQILSFPQDYQM